MWLRCATTQARLLGCIPCCDSGSSQSGLVRCSSCCTDAMKRIRRWRAATSMRVTGVGQASCATCASPTTLTPECQVCAGQAMRGSHNLRGWGADTEGMGRADTEGMGSADTEGMGRADTYHGEGRLWPTLVARLTPEKALGTHKWLQCHTSVVKRQVSSALDTWSGEETAWRHPGETPSGDRRGDTLDTHTWTGEETAGRHFARVSQVGDATPALPMSRDSCPSSCVSHVLLCEPRPPV
jgi:hypothetical protein